MYKEVSKKICQLKAKDSEIKYYTLCLSNYSKDFTVDQMKKNRFKRNCKSFSVDYNAIDSTDILAIYRYLMKET